MRMRNKFGYALGDLGISISYFAVGFFFIFYLTDIVGLDPVLAGLAFFLGKLWDGVNDPIMGVLSDRTRSRYGRKRVYVLFGALPLAISFILLWMIPIDASQWIQFILATVSLTLFATAYTVVVVPYMALVPVMTEDYDERTQITGLRAALSAVGTILGGGAALLLSSFTDAVVGLRIITTGFAIITLFALLIAGNSVRGVEDNPDADDEIVPFDVRHYVTLVKDKNVTILLALKFLGAIGTGVLVAVLPYFAKHILGDPAKSTIGLAIYTIVSALAIPVWNRLTHHHDKRALLLFGNIASAIVLVAISVFVQAGQSIAFYVGCFLLGLVMSAYLLIPYSLVPDLVEYYEYKTGERHESIFFGLWITVHQLGISGAGLMLGLTLGAFGYEGTAAVQSDSALLAVRIALGIIPGLFLVLAALILQRYEVTRALYQSIREQMVHRPAFAGSDGQRQPPHESS